MPRLLTIEPATCYLLEPEDECYHIGEYTAAGGFRASETNQSIYNLKKKPNVPAAQLQWKNRAIQEWGNRLATYLNLRAAARTATLIPAPCSKPIGHPEYDDRMYRVLRQLTQHQDGLDIRPLITTRAERPAQHEGDRLTIDQLRASMSVEREYLVTPLRSTVVIVDDVFTQGRTFKAMQSLLREFPDVRRIVGVFLARTVWPPQIDFDVLDD